MFRTLILALTIVACPAAAGAQSFLSIFTQLPSDFANLAQPTNLAILGGTGLGSLAIHQKDDEIAQHVSDPDQFYAPGTFMGDGYTHAVIGLGVYLGGRFSHNTRVGELGTELLRAQIVSGVITDGLKLATDRTRPDGGRYSFPSGHTSSSFAAAAVLHSHFGWKVGVPAYAVAAYVGTSRMANDKHYASDVLFGAGIGLASGRATSFKAHGKHVAIAPQVTRNSAAVYISIN